jgi:hypothetical protein
VIVTGECKGIPAWGIRGIELIGRLTEHNCCVVYRLLGFRGDGARCPALSWKDDVNESMRKSLKNTLILNDMPGVHSAALDG